MESTVAIRRGVLHDHRRQGDRAEYYTSGAGALSGFESYYLDAVTEGEPPGRWLGRGAARLGLNGEVQAEDMHVLYRDFVHPHTREQLGRRPRSVRRDRGAGGQGAGRRA